MSKEHLVTIGQRIGQELERMEWKPKDLERKTWQRGREVDEQKIRRWLRGQKVWADDIPVVADVLGVSLDDLVRGPEWRAPDLPGIDPLLEPEGVLS